MTLKKGVNVGRLVLTDRMAVVTVTRSAGGALPSSEASTHERKCI